MRVYKKLKLASNVQKWYILPTVLSKMNLRTIVSKPASETKEQPLATASDHVILGTFLTPISWVAVPCGRLTDRAAKYTDEKVWFHAIWKSIFENGVEIQNRDDRRKKF